MACSTRQKKGQRAQGCPGRGYPGINSVREAMKALGITSDESLKKTAATAKEAYDTLTASGIANARELARPSKSAEAAIAANKGIAPAWVEGQAAVRGYRVEVDAAKQVHAGICRCGRQGRPLAQPGRQKHRYPIAAHWSGSTPKKSARSQQWKRPTTWPRASCNCRRPTQQPAPSRTLMRCPRSSPQAEAWLKEWKAQLPARQPVFNQKWRAAGQLHA